MKKRMGNAPEGAILLRINTNIAALQANTNIMRANRKMGLSMEKMSSGLKINSVADDPAGLAIANKLRSQIRGLNVASRNALDGVSMMQTADGAMNEAHSIVQRMRELAVQAASDTNTTDDRMKIQIEIDELAKELDSLADRTEFNGQKLLSGELSRLTINRKGTSEADYITKTVYVSESVPQGTLKYQIDSFPSPAQVMGSIDGDINLGDAKFAINGVHVEFSANDTGDAVLEKIRDACKAAGIEVQVPDYPDNGPLIFTSVKTGAAAEINIQPPSSPALPQLGLTAGVTKGTDAVISGVELVDKNGNGMDTFNSTKTVTYDGNRVIVSSGRDQVIELDLRIQVSSDGSYRLRDGTVLDTSGAPQSGSLTNMSMEITDFGPLILQVGPDKNMEISIDIPSLSANSLGLSGLNYQTIEGANEAISRCDDALAKISKIRSKLGAFENRLERSVSNLQTTAYNTELARSRIQDTDMAQEMTTYTQMSIIAQAGISILAQANQRPQQLLQLLS